MNLKKTLKSMALAGMTFAAGVGAYHAGQSKSEKSDVSGNYQTTTLTTKDTYELQAGVLMPLTGESVSDYEARRLRLEKQENKLRQDLAKHYQTKLKQLESQNADDTLIEMCEDRLEENQKKASYFSYYSEAGQQKLKVFNDNQNRANATTGRSGVGYNGNRNNVHSAGSRSGRSYDF